jgi:dTDP-4-dehydrorhamnose 3,5-epimerase-like enzyme
MLDIPFDIQRVYYLYDIAAGASRAGHSHKSLQQVLIAVSGSFCVHLDDGTEKKAFTLDQPHQGLYIPRMVWREIDNFSPNAVCVSLASLPYDEADYYRRYEDFLHAARRDA